MFSRKQLAVLAAVLAGYATGGPALRGQQASPRQEAYFLTPAYETASPEEALFKKISAQRDRIEAEAHSETVLSVLGEFSAALEEDPANAARLKDLLAAGFRGARLLTEETRLRAGEWLEVYRGAPADELALNRAEFLAEFRALLAPFEQIVTAEFEVVGVSYQAAAGPPLLRTTVHYDLVGSLDGAWRGEQTGLWELSWRRGGEQPWRISEWRLASRTRSRARRQPFADVSARALGRNPSFTQQVRVGVDHWRATLDGALGLDVYGHHGVSAGGIDNDGLDDLYVSQPAGLPNRLYRNNGDATFTDVTAQAGVGVLDPTSMALFADVDNDGDQDLVVITALAPLLFLNGGEGKFRHSPDAFSFSAPPRAQLTSAAMADYDRDGRLDLYLCAYRYHAGARPQEAPSPYHDANNGPANYLLRNAGGARFEDVTAASGMDENNRRFSFAASWEDYDRDGWPDLYVANDFGRNNLYRNRGDGTFEDVTPAAGVEDLGAGMSAAWLDYDRDGLQDLYVGNMWSSAGLRITAQEAFLSAAEGEVRAGYRRHAKGNSLFRNRGDGTFEDVTFEAGVERGHWAWSSDALDFDLDGHEDLLAAGGYITNTGVKDL